MAASHLPEQDGSGSCRGWVLAWKQPRAVDAGKRGLGQPARHNASAATGAARGCRGPDNHRERLPISSGVRAGLSEGVAGVQLCALFLIILEPPDPGSLPDPASVRPSHTTAVGPLGNLAASLQGPADRFASPVPERQAAPCQSTRPTWPKASAPWAASTQDKAWPRPFSKSPTQPSSCSRLMGPGSC